MCRLFKTIVGAELPSNHILPLGMQFLFPKLILSIIIAHAKLGLVPEVPKTEPIIARLSCLFHSLKASGSVVPITRRLTVPKTHLVGQLRCEHVKWVALTIDDPINKWSLIIFHVVSTLYSWFTWIKGRMYMNKGLEDQNFPRLWLRV